MCINHFASIIQNSWSEAEYVIMKHELPQVILLY